MKLKTSAFRNDMTSLNSKDAVLTLLIHLGYLAYDGVTRKAGIQAMQAFFNSVSLAVKDVDANSSVNIVK